ncbi:MAG: hypothetical protein JXQ79_12660 [Rhodobacteraceae bacterium]|nr:hypothetical protein [Paracoccaceae bacterium]
MTHNKTITGISRMDRFLNSESGAVTTDSIIVGAAIIGTAIATMAQVRTAVVPMGTNVETSLTNAQVVSLGTLGSAEEED